MALGKWLPDTDKREDGGRCQRGARLVTFFASSVIICQRARRRRRRRRRGRKLRRFHLHRRLFVHRRLFFVQTIQPRIVHQSFLQVKSTLDQFTLIIWKKKLLRKPFFYTLREDKQQPINTYNKKKSRRSQRLLLTPEHFKRNDKKVYEAVAENT